MSFPALPGSFLHVPIIHFSFFALIFNPVVLGFTDGLLEISPSCTKSCCEGSSAVLEMRLHGKVPFMN